jgi:hypothetical protein
MKKFKEILQEDSKSDRKFFHKHSEIDSNGIYRFSFKKQSQMFKFTQWIKSQGWHSDLTNKTAIVSRNVVSNLEPKIYAMYKKLNK